MLFTVYNSTDGGAIYEDCTTKKLELVHSGSVTASAIPSQTKNYTRISALKGDIMGYYLDNGSYKAAH